MLASPAQIDGEGLQSRSVLVVEDEPRVRRAIVQLFRDWGCSVREAGTLAQGLTLVEPPLDLVVTDVRLPDGNGRDIVYATTLLEPRPTVVAISGAASAPESFELAQLGVRLFVPKPFTRRDFSIRVRALLDELWRTPTDGDDASVGRLDAFASAHALTERESDLVRLAISGVPRSELADALGISENTCKTLIRRLLKKCGAERMSDLARLLLVHEQQQEGRDG